MNLPKILYFIEDCTPTKEEVEKALLIKNAKVVFRNASVVPNEPHALEICDGVEGCVPEIYAKRFGTSAKAIGEYEKSVAEVQSKVGDEKAPTVSKSKGAPAWVPNKG